MIGALALLLACLAIAAGSFGFGVHMARGRMSEATATGYVLAVLFAIVTCILIGVGS